MTVNRTAAVPTPPRITGDATSDLIALVQFLNDFYRATVIESGLLDPVFQATPPTTFDPDDLPDPSASSIAFSQYTANLAYQIAAAARVTADDAEAKALLAITPFTLSDADNQVTITFAEAFDAADDYRVLCQAVDFTGTPPANAFLVVRVARTAADAVITIADAPGAGASVSFIAFIFPN